MGKSAIIDAFAARDFDVLRAAMVSDLVPVIPDATDPQTWDPRELGALGGNVWQAVVWHERLWYRDDASVAAHDAVTCIVLLDGGHYLTNDVEMPRAVLSRAVTTPPDPGTLAPAFGDAWLVPAAALPAIGPRTRTTSRSIPRAAGFIMPPAIGEPALYRDEGGYVHFTRC
jgi:hypothetical protein